MTGCTPGCACDCCTGVTLATPVPRSNRPALPAIGYRVGRHSDFLASMRTTLAADRRATAFTAAESDDPALALCDAAAGMLDVLGFQAERIANEHYVRTATERRSAAGLAALIGYRPAPGVAASADLAFTVRDTPGHPPAIGIPVGTQAQHVPAPDETAQTFETVEAIEARSAWNAIPVAATERWTPAKDDMGLWLAGLATGLAPGDALLIVGEERAADKESNRWDLRIVTAVTPDTARGATAIRWDRPLGSFDPPSIPAAKGAAVYAMRVRAALFGAAAPDARLLSSSKLPTTLFSGEQWANFGISPDGKPPTFFDLDAEQPRVVPGSWVALSRADYIELYRADAAVTTARAQYGLAAKVTRVAPDTTVNLAGFPLRGTTVFAGSEPLAVAAKPIAWPLYGSAVALAAPLDGLAAGRRVVVSGKRQRIRILKSGATLASDAGSARSLPVGETLAILDPPTATAETFAAAASFRLRDDAGRDGKATLAPGSFALEPARDDDPVVSAVREIASVDTALRLAVALPFVLDHATARVNANVAPATVGQSVSETLGSATGAADQRFVLRQAPLTYAPSAVGAGRVSTLELRVNGLLWREVPTLVGAGPADRVYATAEDAEGRTVVVFGDGVEGARPPAGRENVRTRYRRTLGAGGNVAGGTITTLLTRPLGVADVVNPAAAAGGQDGEDTAAIASVAPRHLAALGRAVSVEDHADLARQFGGVGKARPDWIAAGPGRGVLVTVAGDGGAAIEAGGDLARRLAAALAAAGDPLVPVRIAGFRAKPFRVRATVRLAADADPAVVTPVLRDAITTAFGFAARAFGQPVSADEVAAVLHQASPSVVAVTVTQLYTGPSPKLTPRLFAELPAARLDRVPDAAELLLLGAPPMIEVAA